MSLLGRRTDLFASMDSASSSVSSSCFWRPRSFYEVRWIACRLGGARSSRLLLQLVLLGKAYPAHYAPGVEVAGELVLIAVARHQHDDAPVVDILQVYGGRGTQIAREDFRSLDHHLLPDPRLGDLTFRVRGAWPLPIHHGFLLFARSSPASVGYLCQRLLSPRLTRTASDDSASQSLTAARSTGREAGSAPVALIGLVMCATIVGQAVVPLVGGKGHCTGRQTTSHKHWRYGTTRGCCSGWQSPLLTGGASLVRIFLLPRVP